MRLKAVLASLEDVDEQYRDLYAENGEGGYELQIDGIKSHPTVRALAAAHGRTKAELRDAKTKAEHWDELLELRGGEEDLTPDQIHNALETKPAGDEDVQKQIEEAERRGAERAEARAKREIEKLEQAKERLGSALRVRTVDGDLDAAIAKAGVKESLRPAARAFLLQKGPEMVDEDGEFRGIFKQDPDGIPRELTVAEFVDEWAKSEEAAPFLPATEGGSGAGNSGGGGPATAPGKFDGNDPLSWGNNAEKIAAGEMTAT